MMGADKDIIRLKHILDASNKITGYVKIYIETGEQSDLLSEAIERNLIIVGEAVRCLTNNLKDQNTQVPWQSIIGFRHLLVHEYHHIDKEILWDIAENKIPELIDWIEAILEKLGVK